MRFHTARQPFWLILLLAAAFLFLCRMRGDGYPLPGEEIVGALGPLGVWIESMRICGGGVQDTLAIVVLFINAFYITRIVTRHSVLTERTYLPALFYVVASCGFYHPAAALSAALASFLLIAGVEQMAEGFQRRPTYGHFFKASLMLGVAPMLYAPAAIGFPALLAGFIFFRRGCRETVIGLAGYLFPLAAASYIDWILGAPFERLFWAIAEPLRTETGFSLLENRDIFRLSVSGLLAALTILSPVIFIIYAKQSRARARRIFYYFTFLLPVTLGLFFLPSCTPADFMLLAVPLSVMIPNCFVRYSGVVPALVYLLALLGAVWINLAPLLGVG